MNIYIGNLSYEVTEDDLRKEFEAFGQVSSVAIIKDKFTEKSRGFGFVEMPTREQAEAAIAALNGKAVKGRQIAASEAKPKTDRGPRGGGRGGRGF